MNMRILSAILPAVLTIGIANPLIAAPFDQKNVMRGGERLGTMVINEYQPIERVNAANPERSIGGVRIDGLFLRNVWLNYHYLQAILVDDVPIGFVDGTELPQPYIDTPPGGYNGQPFDLLPYYDEPGEIPGFFDEPKNQLRDARNAMKTGPDGFINVNFETWLVCTIRETPGITPDKAGDDNYAVAPLLGWTWGYNVKLTDDGDANLNELVDYDTKANAFAFLMGAPSAQWNQALEAVYGINAASDSFDVVRGMAGQCVVPEPGSAILAGAGLLFFGLLAVRRRFVRPCFARHA